MKTSASDGKRLLLVLIRHGETEWNAAGRLQGQTDVPLSEEGRRQARLLGERLRRCWLHGTAAASVEGVPGIPGPPRHVYSSDLFRARETAEIALMTAFAGDEKPLPPIISLAELRERSFGKFEGLTADEAAARFPGESHHDAGETYEEVYARMLIGFTRIWDDAATDKAAAAGPPVFVFGHGGSMRVLFSHAMGTGAEGRRHFHLGNTGVTIIEWSGADARQAWGRFWRVNDTAHREP